MSDMDMDLLRLAGQGYCCSQILVLLALELQGRENPELVRAMAGLCNGLGQGGHVCGVLSGGACLLGLYAGKGRDGEQTDERLPLMLEELVDWFSETACAGCPGTRCQDILADTGGKPDPQRCGGLVGSTWAKVLEILDEQGIDPTLPRDEDG